MTERKLVPQCGRKDAWSKDRWPGPDYYRPEDNTCSHCGSFDPDLLMARLEAGDVELGPTDKSYKVYLRNKGGAPFLQHYRNCPKDAKCTGPDDCTHWVTRETSSGKFYFQHLSAEQKTRFVELLNDKRLHIGYPGHFYSLPFFLTYVGEPKKPQEAP